jgi:HNH endonuclease
MILPERCYQHPQAWTNLLRRFVMDSVSLWPQEDNAPEKCCSKCKQLFPATAEFFYRDRNKKDGLYTICKTCGQTKDRPKQSNDKIQSDTLEGQKRCAKCKKICPATTEFFQRDRNRPDGLYSYCKKCCVERNGSPEVRELKKAYNQSYYKIPEKRSQILSQRKENYHNNPEVRQYALDYNKLPHVREYQRSYLKDYNKRPEARAKNRANKHVYRSREKSVAGKHTAQQIRDLLKRQKYKCYYCGKKFEKKDGGYVYNIEHTFPISRVAGTDIPANDISYIVLSCYPCNRDKGDKFPWEFPEGGRLL